MEVDEHHEFQVMCSDLHSYFIQELLACARSSTCSPWLCLSPHQSTRFLRLCRLNLNCFVCVLISTHRNFHFRWSRSSNLSSGPEHLEGVNWETQLRFIYHLNPHRLLTLPAGSTLTALVVRCEKSRLTPIKQQSCRTDSSTDFLPLDVWAGNHVRKEMITDLLLFFICSCCLLTWTDRDICRWFIYLFIYLLLCMCIQHRKSFRNEFHWLPLIQMRVDWSFVETTNWTATYFFLLSSPLVKVSSVCIHWQLILSSWLWQYDRGRDAQQGSSLSPLLQMEGRVQLRALKPCDNRGGFTFSPAGSLHWILLARPGAAPVQPVLSSHVFPRERGWVFEVCLDRTIADKWEV